MTITLMKCSLIFKEMISTKWIRNKAAKIKAAFKEDFTRNSKLTAEQRERKRMRAVSRISFGVMFAAMAAQMFGITAFAEDAGAGGGKRIYVYPSV